MYFCFVQPDLVAGSFQSSDPHGGIQPRPLFGAGKDVIHFYNGLKGMDSLFYRVLDTYPWFGSAWAYSRCAAGGVRSVATVRGFRDEDVHHLARIASNQAMAQPSPTQKSDCVQAPWHEIGVIGQTIKLKRHNIRKHALVITFIRQLAVRLPPALSNHFCLADFPNGNGIDQFCGCYYNSFPVSVKKPDTKCYSSSSARWITNRKRSPRYRSLAASTGRSFWSKPMRCSSSTGYACLRLSKLAS